MNENSMTRGVSFQGLWFRYTEHGTLLISLRGSHAREFNPRAAADLLTYLNTSQGELFKHAREGDMATWPQVERSVLGKSEITRDILDAYEQKNAYAQGNDGKQHDGGEHDERCGEQR